MTASFVIPAPAIPQGASPGTYAASAWVGIDGDTCGNAILQTGLDFTVDARGSVSYDGASLPFHLVYALVLTSDVM